jgi:aminopeptidase YwaD
MKRFKRVASGCFQIAFVVLVSGFFRTAAAQNIDNIKNTMMELSSPAYFGRGYEQNGANKTAHYIAEQYINIGVEKMFQSYMQRFKFSINSFPDTLELTINGKGLTPGTDYLLRKSAHDTSATFNITYLPNNKVNMKSVQELEKMNLKNHILVFDVDFRNENSKKFDTVYKRMLALNVAGIAYLTRNPLRSFAVQSLKVDNRFLFDMNKDSFDTNSTTMTLKVHASYLKDCSSCNVVGMIKGKRFPDKYIVIGGHYDHLGMMGPKVYFPGADDNASGIGVMLEMARYFKENQPDYSLIFVAFSGEEAGLLGSYHFVKNCLVPIENIKFMLDLDMVGYGETGFNIHNGVNEPLLMEKMNKIVVSQNLDIKLIPKENINQSDHYPFTEQKIPALFVTSGVKDSKFYHSVDDTYSSVTFDKIGPLMHLLITFVKDFE